MSDKNEGMFAWHRRSPTEKELRELVGELLDACPDRESGESQVNAVMAELLED